MQYQMVFTGDNYAPPQQISAIKEITGQKKVTFKQIAPGSLDLNTDIKLNELNDIKVMLVANIK